jgi:hypothetical protein
VTSNLNTRVDKAMSTEQFTQVVDAILDGKYSWACVLILRFAGYNPLHYIPYRTYNRLMKENPRSGKSVPQSKFSSKQKEDSTLVSDLNFLEPLEEDYSHIRGGDRINYSAENRWAQLIGMVQKIGA